MKTRAAILTGTERDWEIVELELDDPGPGEVTGPLGRVRPVPLRRPRRARATCLSRFPMVGGHEGAGIVEKVGPGVTRSPRATTS